MQLRKTLFSTGKSATAALGIWVIWAAAAPANDLRIVTYNVDADTSGGVGTPRPGLATVLQAIGSESLNGDAPQPIDVLALQELCWVGSGSSPTLQTIVADLNSIYGAGA